MTDPRSAGRKPALSRNDRFILGAVVLAATLIGLVLYTRAAATSPPTSMVWSLRRKPRPAQVGPDKGGGAAAACNNT
jgi:hypothetical protein